MATDTRSTEQSLGRIAVLASHGGTALQAVIDACESGLLPAEVVLVISNNGRSGALERARRHGVEALHLSSRTHPEAGGEDRAIAEALLSADPDLVVLAGYMKRLGTKALEAFENRIINTHPALLPRHGGQGFYGDRVHQAVLEAGDEASGATVHLVNDEYDRGAILAQSKVEVRSGDTIDTLRDRVQAAERKLLLATLSALLEATVEGQGS